MKDLPLKSASIIFGVIILTLTVLPHLAYV